MQIKYKLEIVIDKLYERKIPDEIRQSFPELKEITSKSRFYKIYSCLLDRDVSRDEIGMLNDAEMIEEEILSYHCEEVLPEWVED